MTKAAFAELLGKATEDAIFRSHLNTDFTLATKPYALTREEKERLRAEVARLSLEKMSLRPGVRASPDAGRD